MDKLYIFANPLQRNNRTITKKPMLATTQQTIDYIIFKLIFWGVSDEYYTTPLNFQEPLFEEDFCLKKIESLPFLLTTANGKENRERLINNAFGSFEFREDQGYFVQGLNLEETGTMIFEFNIEGKLRVRDSIAVNGITNFEIAKILIENTYNTIGQNIELWEFAKEGIDYSVDTIFKEKHNIKLYSLSYNNIRRNIGLSPVFNRINSFIKTENGRAVYQTSKTVSKSIILTEMSVYAEKAENVLVM